MEPVSLERRSPLLREFLHISTLNSFAIVQPILDQLISNSAFLRYYNYSGAAIFLVIGILMTAVPGVSILLLGTLRWRSCHWAAGVTLRVTILLLTCQSALIGSRWLSTAFELARVGIPDSILSGMSLCFAGVLTVLYFRSEGYRTVLAVSSIGVLIFPMSFLGTSSIREQVFGLSSQHSAKAQTAANPAPTVMIVFDGLCGMSLLDEKHQVDAVRYPSFARLAAMSSLYRNATTVHVRTDHALPAILSSCYPEEAQTPVETDYPQNLFRLIDNTNQYQSTIFEPYTQMAPEHLRKIANRRGLAKQTFDLLNTVVRVYERICLPRELESLQFDVPREWFRMLPPDPSDLQTLDGKIVYSWDTDRDEQIEHFLNCLRSTPRPGFRFLHIAVPHDPWTLLPSGMQYRQVRAYGEHIVGCPQEHWIADEWPVNQGWQRYLWQVQYADRCLGKVLDRLSDLGQLEESLIIVTADHGMGFHPGSERRVPDSFTLPDIVSVPLMIKHPRQSEAIVSDRNVETVDILPTIATILGLQADDEWEGESIQDDAPEKPRKTITGNLNTILDARFPQRFQYVDRMLRVFGSGAMNDQFKSLQTIPELMDLNLSTLRVGNPSLLQCNLIEGETSLDPNRPGFIPCYFEGTLTNVSQDVNTVSLAIALNGVVRATTKTCQEEPYSHSWSAFLPESGWLQHENSIQLFEVKRTDQRVTLQEIRLQAISD